MRETQSRALTRPTSVAEMVQCLSRLRSPESARRAQAFKPKPTDIIVATYPKCGTTWMQQIVQGLRTGGSMDFKEITEAVPWLESAYDLGLDIDGSQVAEPRAYKTHYSWDEVPKGGRYIYVIRDPKDVLVSFYRFFEGWFFETDSISMDAFAQEFFLKGSRSGRYWEHLRSWWDRRNEEDTLLMCFEDLKVDLDAAVRSVARFIGCSADDAAVEIATRQASFEFMREHGRQFDDHLMREARDEACGLPPGGTSTKVRAGGVGAHARELSPEMRETLDDIWRDEIHAKLGFKTYDDLRRAVGELS